MGGWCAARMAGELPFAASVSPLYQALPVSDSVPSASNQRQE
jgi:hypothetical protein